MKYISIFVIIIALLLLTSIVSGCTNTEPFTSGSPAKTSKINAQNIDANSNLAKVASYGGCSLVSLYSSLTDAVVAIGIINKVTLVLDAPTTLTVDTVVPSNIEIRGTVNGLISLEDYDLTINGFFDAGLYQVFSGNGTVDMANNTVKEFYPQWWGALGDGVHDDSTYILKTLDSAGRRGGGNVRLPIGTYFCTKTLMVPSYVKLYGDGIGKTIILNPAGGIHGHSNGGWINASVGTVGTTHSTISDMTIDHVTNGTHTNGVALVPTGAHKGVIPDGTPTTYAVVERVEVLGALTHQYLIWSLGGRHIKILNNIVDGGQPTLSETSYGQDGIEIYGGDDVLVQANTVMNIEGTGIWTFSDKTNQSVRVGVRIIDNYVTNSRSGIGGANSSDAKHIHYKNNIVKNCWTTGISFNAINGVNLQDIQIVGNSVSDVATQGISMHGGVSSSTTDEGIVIRGNVVRNSGLNGIIISNHSNVKIDGNVINGADRGIYISSSAPGAVNISMENNTITNSRKEGIYVYFANQVEVINNIIKNYNLDQNNHSGIYFHAGNNFIAAGNIFKYGGVVEPPAILSNATDVGLYDNMLQYSATLPSPFSNLGSNPR